MIILYPKSDSSILLLYLLILFPDINHAMEAIINMMTTMQVQ